MHCFSCASYNSTTQIKYTEVTATSTTRFRWVHVLMWQPGKGETGMHWSVLRDTNIQQTFLHSSLACHCQLVQPDSTALISISTWVQITHRFGSDEIHRDALFLIWPAFQIPASHKIMIDEHKVGLAARFPVFALLCESCEPETEKRGTLIMSWRRTF